MYDESEDLPPLPSGAPYKVRITPVRHTCQVDVMRISRMSLALPTATATGTINRITLLFQHTAVQIFGVYGPWRQGSYV